MKWTNVLRLVLPATCVVAACVAATNGIAGWGWFLVIAVFSSFHAELKDTRRSGKRADAQEERWDV